MSRKKRASDGLKYVNNEARPGSKTPLNECIFVVEPIKSKKKKKSETCRWRCDQGAGDDGLNGGGKEEKERGARRRQTTDGCFTGEGGSRHAQDENPRMDARIIFLMEAARNAGRRDRQI